MSVIAAFRIPSTDFELGRILRIEGVSSIELENLVPIGDATVPLFWIHNSTRDSFAASVQRHPTVNSASEVDVFEDRALFTLDWDANHDHLFEGIRKSKGQLLSAVGTPDKWNFEIRFPTRDALSEFTTHCEDAQVSLEATRVYNPTDPTAGPWYGLSEPQREAITLAVRNGYYDIPRGCTTKELADELGISDQAVTERLRRAIVALTTHALFPSDSET
ncbi:helix-turn-helix domain-containing protein [Natronorubrum sulfidifaciens]|uniref:Bacterio-opsin activator HTH domain-containing protein n=1 Tax=Natronorubrum sulfidifaciens JCM 14089 TaxID=1230460 RepID=L9WG30_9EURY|nr:helix-turn-helix domain-containing protein [Natronorubrum sulfidifaciens]ELY48307.1 bacterio-opsin activator HTH domain-containing protein [Natronorubrum sulfidifaciens JCM 14089]